MRCLVKALNFKGRAHDVKALELRSEIFRMGNFGVLFPIKILSFFSQASFIL